MEQQYIGGRHAVLEALRAGRAIHKIWMQDNAHKQLAQDIMTAAKKAGIAVQRVDRRKLDQLLSEVPHQGVVAQVAAQSYVDVDDIIARAKRAGEVPFILVLDEIEDPHNLGSIIRTAECTGVHGIIIPKRRAVGLTAAVSKISVGAIEHVAVARVTNVAQTIDALKEQGIWIAGADGAADQSVFASDVTMPIALVIGNEHKGIGRLIKQKCDFLIKLPMFGRINSLNASVAAGAIMYEIVRQRLTMKR